MLKGRKGIKEYCVYRYRIIDTNEVIYIGKTDANLKNRIDAHAKEEKFIPYLGECCIDYIILKNKTETDIIEKYYINKYKPVLNEKDKLSGSTDIQFQFKLPDWIPYENYVLDKINASQLKNFQVLEEAYKNELFLDALFSADGNSFTLDFLHTGILFNQTYVFSEIKTECYIEKDVMGHEFLKYIYQYTPLGIDISDKYFELKEKIYRKAAELWNFSKSETQILSQLQEAECLLNELIDFAENNFELNGLEKDMFLFSGNDELISIFSPYFSSVFYDGYNSYFVTVNEEACQYLDKVKERIAEQKLKIYRTAGILLESDENSF